MKNYGLNELREMFLSFFETKGHLRLPSFSLIPQNDASLLLINSGMAPMKPWFKGEQEPPRHRVCTCQKCIRTGDIENIGKTARHGTFFEMLGNFSFGDYFKKEAIAWSWEFLTSPEWVGLDPDRLYPSVYVDDDEAASIWEHDIGIAPERIFRFGKEDNFWEHGAGPCGPCSEIYYDRGEKYGCGKPGCTVGCDCDRYIEVWNNVFSQFDNDGHNNYTELKEKQKYITTVIRSEEEKFGRTIDAGLRIFSELLETHRAKGETVFSGADAFKLYDTYGFPLDLTVEMCEDAGYTVDQEGFRSLMQEQRVRAREARKALGDLGWAGISFGKDIPDTEFIGYDKESCEASILATVREGETSSFVSEGDEAILVLDKSVLYAEMGGQLSDTGTIRKDGFVFEVQSVQKNKGGKFMHSGVVRSGQAMVGDTVTVTRDADRRAALCRAHSATHLLHKALREVLGEHVHQAGSLVDTDLLRFDFTHFSAPTAEELDAVREAVNRAVLADFPVVTKEMSLEEAKKTHAAALFGEKYGEVVRVVDMGGWSLELCGGTHVSNTAKIGSFVLVSEGSVASGVRRIEALTGLRALQYNREQEKLLLDAAARFKTVPAELPKKLDQQAAELKELRRSLEQLRDQANARGADSVLEKAEQVGPVKVVAFKTEGDPNTLRKQGDSLRDKEPAIVALMAAVNGEKLSFLCVCGKEAVAAGVKAGDLIRQISAIAGGKGGGKPDSAMGGGTDVSKLDTALASLKPFVEEIVSK